MEIQQPMVRYQSILLKLCKSGHLGSKKFLGAVAAPQQSYFQVVTHKYANVSNSLVIYSDSSERQSN